MLSFWKTWLNNFWRSPRSVSQSLTVWFARDKNMDVRNSLALREILKILGSAVVGGLAVHFLTTRREVANRKHIFRGFIQSLIFELDAINIDDAIKAGNAPFLYDWQKAVVPTLRVECAKVFQDIRGATKRDELSALLKQFSAQGGRNAEPYKELRYQPQIDRLKQTLTSIKQCAE